MFYLSTYSPLPNQNILPVWGYVYSTQYMQKSWLGKGENAVPQLKMQTLQNKIWTILFVYAVVHDNIKQLLSEWVIVM